MDDEQSAQEPASVLWRKGDIGLPSLVALLVGIAIAGLAAASISGWGSVAVLIILIVACLGLITSWVTTG